MKLVSGAILQSNLHLVEYPRPRTGKVRKDNPDLELERCAKVLGELTANISAVLKPVSHRSCHAKSLKRRSATHSDYLVAHLVRKSLQCISIHFASVLQMGGVSVHLGWHRSTQQTISIRPRAGAATQVRPSFGG